MVNEDVLNKMEEGYVSAISDYKLRTLILEVYDYKDKISQILHSAEDLVERTKDYYKTEDGETFRKKFNEFSTNFSTLLANIKSYGDDLTSVLQKYKNKF